MKPCKNQTLQLSPIFMTPGTWNLSKIRSFNFLELSWSWVHETLRKSDASIFFQFSWPLVHETLWKSDAYDPRCMKPCKNPCFVIFKKVKILLKTWFRPWNRAKSKKLRALLLLQLLKVATGDHFQDSKFSIWLKHPVLSLVSFYAAGPFDDYPGFQLFLTLGKHFATECMYSTVDKS